MNPSERKRKGRTFIVIVFIALLCAGVYAETQHELISDAFRLSQKKLLPDGITYEYPQEQNPVFSGGKNGFLCVTKDGADYYSYKGETVWRITFTMQAPHIIKNGESWAILEPMGRTAYVCNPSGLLYEVTTEYPILNASLNGIQCLTLILEADADYEIQVFNNEGQSAFTRKSVLDGVYPVCATVSNDGLIYSVSYIDTTKTSLSSRLLYFYTDSGAKRYGTDTNAPFKAIEKQGSVVSQMFFGNNDNLACISDNEIFITTSKGDEIFKFELQNHMADFSFGGTMFGYTTGRAFSKSVADSPSGSAEWLDYNGGVSGGLTEVGAELIDIYNKYILLKTAGGYILSDDKGREIWAYDVPEDIITVIPIGEKQAVVARKGFAEIYSLKKPPGSGEEL